MSSDNPSVETLATGYGLIEGPRVDDRNRLYFSDVVRGGVYRRSPDGEIETIVPKRRGVGGIALHAEGGVVVSGRNVCHVKDGATRIVFSDESIPSFNDLFTDAEGRIIVGSMLYDPFKAEGPRPTGTVYRIDTDGRVSQLYDDVGMCNGIGMSRDGRRLFQNDTARNEIVAHDIDPKGRCSARRVFARAERGSPDGLAVDEEDGIWIAEHSGSCVSRYTADGKLDRHIDVPARIVTSLCLGGPDRRDLYIVSADNTDDPALEGSIFRTRVDVAGLPAALARV
jgi:D-xylonolactonase